MYRKCTFPAKNHVGPSSISPGTKSYFWYETFLLFQFWGKLPDIEAGRVELRRRRQEGAQEELFPAEQEFGWDRLYIDGKKNMGSRLREHVFTVRGSLNGGSCNEVTTSLPITVNWVEEMTRNCKKKLDRWVSGFWGVSAGTLYWILTSRGLLNIDIFLRELFFAVKIAVSSALPCK